MANNFLEQLVAEWLECRGYFVRRNVNVGPRPKGGFEGELDVIAFHPQTAHCIHYECSTDAESWEKRQPRFARKFEVGRKYVPSIFTGLQIGPEIEQVALFLWGSSKNRTHIGGGRVQAVGDLLKEVRKYLLKRPLEKSAVPEGFMVLRALQFAAHRWR